MCQYWEASPDAYVVARPRTKWPEQHAVIFPAVEPPEQAKRQEAGLCCHLELCRQPACGSNPQKYVPDRSFCLFAPISNSSSPAFSRTQGWLSGLGGGREKLRFEKEGSVLKT